MVGDGWFLAGQSCVLVKSFAFIYCVVGRCWLEIDSGFNERRESYDLVVIVNNCEFEGIRVSVRSAPPRQCTHVTIAWVYQAQH